MEYTTSALARLSGVSARTLRYYDQIGLLQPTRAANGYRRYGSAEAARLQQILFYRETGLELEDIARILDSDSFDANAALESHLRQLKARRTQLEKLITTAEKTLRAMKGEHTMTDKEKFEGFKKDLIEENDRKYGKEVRQRWGADAAEKSNAKMMNMTQEEYARFEALGKELHEVLATAVQEGDPAGPAAQKAAAMHKQWLCFTWPHYSAEAHRGLVQMYLDDERFKAYYDGVTPGAAEMLQKAVNLYLDEQEK